MKRNLSLLSTIVATGLVLTGCETTSVRPHQNPQTNQGSSGSRLLSGGGHPAPNPQTSQTSDIGPVPAGYGSPEQERLKADADRQQQLLDAGARVPAKYVNEDGMWSILPQQYWEYPNGR